ncbi:hypothetical protein BDV12DRAFT_197732 [Aspergillus spectabilis]
MGGVAGSYWINYRSLEVILSSSSWQWRTTFLPRALAQEYSELQSMAETGSESKSLVKQCLQDPSIRHLLIQTSFIIQLVLFFTAVHSLMKVVSVFLYAFFLADRYGRRPLLLIGSTLSTLCLLYLSVFLGVANISASASPSPAAWVAIVATCLFAIGFGFV